MYATIHRYDDAARLESGVIPAGRRLASALGELPGFVAYVLVETGDGALLSISIFEDQPGLTDGARLIEGHVETHHLGPLAAVRPFGGGEVIVQRGI